MKRGVDNTTIQDIVNELDGLTKGAINHHLSPRKKSWKLLDDEIRNMADHYFKQLTATE